MEHRTLSEIKHVAQVTRLRTERLSRRERLERWAAALERDTGRQLKPLMRVEFLPKHEREFLRRDDSPLAVAYADPVLREEGLMSDYLGEAVTFFELSDSEAHYLLCDCHYHGGVMMTPGTVAKRVRGVASRVTLRELWQRMCRAALGPRHA
jgi:hypothetical protein